jgi:thymidylate synthase (FAD)
VPESWRSRPVGGIKQGSAGTHLSNDYHRGNYAGFIEAAQSLYENMIEDGVAPEQARMVLPQSMLTTYWVTGSLYAWANAYIQRSDPHAQLEIQELAKQWDSIIRPLYPVSWSALVD